MKNILEYLENTAGRKKDEIAVDDGSRCLTWGELKDASRKMGSVLADSLTPGQPAVVLAEKSAVTLASMLGIVYAGGFYVPVHPEQPSGRICKILDTLKTEVVITEKEHLGLLKECGYRGRIILMEEALQGGINCEKLLEIRRNSRETDLLYGIFTSGSTGIPKCVVVSHKSVIRFIDHFVKIFGITEDDRIGNQAPFDFDVSVKDIYSSMATGAALVLIPRELFAMPPRLLDYLCRKKITTLIWAVSALCLISALKGLKYKVPETVRKVMFSGESMPVSQLRIWREALPDAKFVNLYGPTEITCNCTYYKVEKDFQDQDRLPIGRALPGRKVFLTDENQNEIVIPGKIGEICVAGESLSDGYYNQPEQTEEKFVTYLCEQRTYRTGDEGYYGTDGELYFAGRKDFQIKHMGRRIELEEIENALSGIPGVDSSICVFDRDRNRIIGFYKGKPASGDVRRALKEKLPPYMVPNRLLQAEDIPLNKNGKKDRAYFMRKISEETEEWKKGTRKAETGKKEIEKKEKGETGV